jgi:hypothetical protein
MFDRIRKWYRETTELPLGDSDHYPDDYCDREEAHPSFQPASGNDVDIEKTTLEEEIIRQYKKILDKKYSCVICHQPFTLDIKELYISKDSLAGGVISSLTGEKCRMWDTFDCPICGCQNRVQERLVEAVKKGRLGRDFPEFEDALLAIEQEDQNDTGNQ